MRLTRRTLLWAAVATVTMGVARPVSAQMSPEDLLLQLDGLEGAYARKYIADRDLGFATPVVADEATPDTLLLTVLDFATAEDATRAFETRLNGLTVRLLLGVPELSLEESAVNGLGDRGMLYTGVDDSGDEPEHVAVLAVQDGDVGILIEARGDDAAMLETVRDVAEFAVAAEPGDGPVEVDEVGATGGVFELMPGAADARVQWGLVSMYDYDLLLNGGDEPLGHLHAEHHAEEATPAG